MKLFKKPWFSQPQYAMWIVAACFFLLYVSTAPRVNIGYADSDEFLAVGYNLGVAHPPGYPLYVLLLFIFTHLPIPGTVAFKGHLLSALLSSLALGVIFYTCWILISQALQKKRKQSIIGPILDHWLIAGLSTGLLGVSFLFWLYSHITEAFALNNLFAALLISQVVKLLLQTTKIAPKQWLILAVVAGIGLSHHQTLILIFPAILVLLWNKRQQLSIHRIIRMAAVGLISFVTPFLLIYLYQAHDPQASWYVKPGLAGLVQLIFRREFSGIIATTGEQTSAYLPKIEINQIIQQIPDYVRYLFIFFGSATLIAGVAGAFQWIQKNKSLALIFIGGFLFAGIFFAGVMGIPSNVLLQAANHRMYILGFIFIPFLLVAGWYEIFWRFQQVSLIFGAKKNIINSIIVTFVISLFGWRLVSQYPLVDLKKFTIISQQYGQMIDELKPDALVACFTDVSCFALQYEQVVNHKRPDVIVLHQALPLVRDRLLSDPNLRGFVYPENPYVTYDYITWNIGQRPVYAVDITEVYYHLLGLNEGFTFYIPHGNHGELTRQMPMEMPPTSFQTADFYSQAIIPPQDRMRLWLKGDTIHTHIFNSTIYAKTGLRDRAREELNQASNLQHELPESFGNLEGTRRAIEESEALENSALGDSVIPAEELLKLAQQWTEQKRPEVAYKIYFGAVTAYPRDVAARLALAEAYKQIPDLNLASIEYQNVLRLDPQNATASQELEDLQIHL